MMVSDTGWGNGQKGQCHFRSKLFPIFTIYGHNEFSAKYRAQNEAYKIEKTKKWEKSMNDRELER